MARWRRADAERARCGDAPDDVSRPFRALGVRGRSTWATATLELVHFGRGHTDHDVVVGRPGRRWPSSGDLLETVGRRRQPPAGPDALGRRLASSGRVDSVAGRHACCVRRDCVIARPATGAGDRHGRRRHAARRDALAPRARAQSRLYDAGQAEPCTRSWKRHGDPPTGRGRREPAEGFVAQALLRIEARPREAGSGHARRPTLPLAAGPGAGRSPAQVGQGQASLRAPADQRRGRRRDAPARSSSRPWARPGGRVGAGRRRARCRRPRRPCRVPGEVVPRVTERYAETVQVAAREQPGSRSRRSPGSGAATPSGARRASRGQTRAPRYHLGRWRRAGGRGVPLRVEPPAPRSATWRASWRGCQIQPRTVTPPRTSATMTPKSTLPAGEVAGAVDGVDHPGVFGRGEPVGRQRGVGRRPPPPPPRGRRGGRRAEGAGERDLGLAVGHRDEVAGALVDRSRGRPGPEARQDDRARRRP